MRNQRVVRGVCQETQEIPQRSGDLRNLAAGVYLLHRRAEGLQFVVGRVRAGQCRGLLVQHFQNVENVHQLDPLDLEQRAGGHGEERIDSCGNVHPAPMAYLNQAHRCEAPDRLTYRW